MTLHPSFSDEPVDGTAGQSDLLGRSCYAEHVPRAVHSLAAVIQVEPTDGMSEAVGECATDLAHAMPSMAAAEGDPKRGARGNSTRSTGLRELPTLLCGPERNDDAGNTRGVHASDGRNRLGTR